MPKDPPPHPPESTLLLTDIVDSTALAVAMGEAAVSALWAAHDHQARTLLRQWQGQEIDKSDGMLLLFARVDDALAYAQDYHDALATLNPPLQARVGLHCGPVVCRHAAPEDVARGAKPMEVDGAAKAIAARLMSLARGGQTLLSGYAHQQAQPGAPASPRRSHGHWRLKGLPDPLEVFEAPRSDPAAAFGLPPADHDKAYRVAWSDGLWRPVELSRHSLPAERDAFIGREGPLETLAGHLNAGQRLITLMGTGGTGKTRLALRYAHAWRGDFAGGAWWCDLAAARTLDGIVHAVAQGLDLPLGKGDPVAQIGKALAGRGPALLLLDNFEQVVAMAEATVGLWLAQAPECRIVVTSRERLHIRGEVCQVLAPFSADEGVAMFQQRALAAWPGFAPDATEQAALVPLVRLLDGLPLAIELAAARVNVLAPTQLLQRLSDRFGLLRGARAQSGRQSTLRATLDWSWDLLDPLEQQVLASLSVFEGGWTLEAATAVVGTASLPASTAASPPDALGDLEVADLLGRLISKSLVHASTAGRFGLLVSVRDYAAERLSQWPQSPQLAPASPAMAARDAVARQHAGYFKDITRRLPVVQALPDIDNVVSACRFALGARDAELALALLEVAWALLVRNGPFAAGEALASAAASLPGWRPQQTLAIQAVLIKARMAQGKTADARLALDDCRATMAALSPAAEVATLLRLDGTLLELAGEQAAGIDRFGASLAMAEALGDDALACEALNSLGGIHLTHGDYPAARQFFTRALARMGTGMDDRWRAGVMGNIALAEHQLGELDQAEAHYRQALSAAQQAGDKRWEANTLCNFGMMLFESGQWSQATELWNLGLKIAEAIGYLKVQGALNCNIALACLKCGDNASARDYFRNSIEIARLANDRISEAEFLKLEREATKT